MSQKYLVVSIHDATPKFRKELNGIISELDQRKVTPRSVLVIPNYKQKYNILFDEEFVFWLSQLKSKGDELVQHGYDHIQQTTILKNKKNYSLQEKNLEMYAREYAEFQNIDYNEAKRRIQKGKEIMRLAGIVPVGFVAPVWLVNPESEKAIKNEGFRYMALVNSLRIFSSSKDLESEVVGFASSPRIIDYLLRFYDLYLTKIRLINRELVQVAIHPQDLWNTKTFKYALKIIDELRNNRQLITYADFVKNKKI